MAITTKMSPRRGLLPVTAGPHVADANDNHANADDEDGKPLVPGKNPLKEDPGEDADKDEVGAGEHLKGGGSGEGEGNEGEDPAGQM